MSNGIEHCFHVLFDFLYIFLGEVAIHTFCLLFLNWVVLLIYKIM